MERRHCRVLCLIILFLTGLFPLLSAADGGARAEVRYYVLPQYHNGVLKFVVYGDSAVNKGALLYLTQARIDIPGVQISDNKWREVQSLEEAMIYSNVKNEKFPVAYPLDASKEEIRKFWQTAKHQRVRAWIFADYATFDKNADILRSDSVAHFRSRELDADGVGFDAYSKRKFIHIRSKVKAYLRISNIGKQKVKGKAAEATKKAKKKAAEAVEEAIGLAVKADEASEKAAGK